MKQLGEWKMRAWASVLILGVCLGAMAIATLATSKSAIDSLKESRLVRFLMYGDHPPPLPKESSTPQVLKVVALAVFGLAGIVSGCEHLRAKSKVKTFLASHAWTSSELRLELATLDRELARRSNKEEIPLHLPLPDYCFFTREEVEQCKNVLLEKQREEEMRSVPTSPSPTEIQGNQRETTEREISQCEQDIASLKADSSVPEESKRRRINLLSKKLDRLYAELEEYL